jgi:SpoVK/Ycf46/Vps4 family AAA+-type ATPase
MTAISRYSAGCLAAGRRVILMHEKSSFENDLGRYMDAGFPIIYICSYEEDKVDCYISKVAGKREIIEWNGANGFVDKNAKVAEDWTLEKTLTFFNKNAEELERKIFVIKDTDKMMDSDKVVALLKEMARKIRNGTDATVIIVSPIIKIPENLKKYVTVMGLDLPDENEIRTIVDRFVTENDIDVFSELIDEMADAFKGLTEFEIEDLLCLAIAEDGELTKKSLKLIFDQKKQMVLKEGILEMIPIKESLDDIGGLEVLKDWLKIKAGIFKNISSAKKFGVSMPKGVLIAGIPGCGKSLSAKAAGKLFDVPLLRLDMGSMMGKYVGDSESNMRKAIKLAEAMAPCVLWVDELEKAFAGIGASGSGGEVINRLFGIFLTWMQEKTSATFVVATANDISRLPSEFMRKGRFDEIFYVPLPNNEERKKIFEIHLNKRREDDVKKIDIDALVSKTEGYSGADIEGVVCESIENVFVRGSAQISTEDILECIENTHCLSEIKKEDIDKMKRSYEENKFKKASR